MKSSEGKPSRLKDGFRAAMAGAAFLGAVGSVELPARTAPAQASQESRLEKFDADVEVSAFVDRIASWSVNDRAIPSSRFAQQFDILVSALQEKKSYFSHKPTGLMSSAIPNSRFSSETREKTRQTVLQKLSTMDIKIKLDNQGTGTAEGRRKNNLSLLKEVLEKLPK